MSDLIRSSALNNVPDKKLQAKLSAVENSDDDLKTKNVKITIFNRYAESNIPIEYWDLKMESDFFGDPRLLKKYNEYISDLKNNYLAGKSVCFAGNHGLGKQIDLETELPTPNGFIKLIDLKEGDQLFDEKGNICNVTKLHPINLSPKSYEITFDDGVKIKACAEHLWLTWTRKDRRDNLQPTVKNTEEILKTLKFKNGIRMSANHSIQCTLPIQYSYKDLPIDPYVLGCWLGDGTTASGNIETSDREILRRIKKSGYSINLIKSTKNNGSKSSSYRIGNLVKKNGHWIGQLKYQLRHLNLLNNKHIPDVYLYASYEQRLELLRGVLDTDGHCNNLGGIEYTSTVKTLAENVAQLILSLGIKTKIKKNKSFLNGERKKDRYRITFTTKLPVFNLDYKKSSLRLTKSQVNRSAHRYIVDIKAIDATPMRCITVDSSSHLFLITRNFIPTHNTLATTCILKKSVQKGYTALYTTFSDIVNVLTQAPIEDKFLAQRELAMVDYLAIDEVDSRFILSGNAADLYAKSLEGVFRTRSQNKLPTLMCTNSPNVLESFNGSLKASMESLMKGYLEVFPVFGSDYRRGG